MSRDELQHIRDRLLQLAEASSGQRRPLNVKRKVALSRQTSKTAAAPKLSMQDFVRMDPGYTPDIEHLVFPNPKKRSPQQVAPATLADAPPPPPPPPSNKTRSRLAEMFALSRHLQRSSTERQEVKARTGPQVNRSIDSAIESSNSVTSHARQAAPITDANKRWVYSVDETVRQNFLSRAPSRVSPSNDNNKNGARGSNISILHLRSTSEPWEKETVPNYSSAARSYFASSRSTTAASAPSAAPPLTKHQSLGSSTSSSATHKWTTSPSFHSGSEVNSPGIFTFSGSCNRELSPVRWCDREVDGVYLGKSGWVQVQQRSLDDNRRASYSINLAKSLQSNRTGIKLANYHFSSEPNKSSSFSRTSSVDPRLESRPEPRSDPQPDTHRPAYLVLQNREYDRKIKTPSPLPESGSFSPPSITPIISPPPAFQDKTKSPVKSRAFFGKTPFLPRSNAIEDSDNSPPRSPPIVSQWKTTAPNAPTLPKPKPVIKTSPGIEKPPRATKKVPQAKSLEETTASRRMQFKQKYGSSSSSSSSMGFRSLDSCLNRTSSVMPRLSENTDSSIDVYEDADEEDNNSSSVNMSMVNTAALQAEYNRKLSPSGRPNRLTHYRNQIRRSPAGSDTNKHSPTSSSSSSNEFLSRSPTNNPQQSIRRPAPVRPYQPVKSPQDDATQRVRRSRSLQLPERTPPPSFERAQKVSPQHPDQHRVVVKVTGNHQMPERKQYSVGSKQTSMERGEVLEEELLREAEVVTGFLYGSRSRAAAQALLMHRYNNNNISAEEKNKESNKPMLNSDLTVYYVGNNKNERQRLLVRGATSPSLPTTHQFDSSKSVSCSPENCDFWPHCAHRDSLNREAQFVMRSSQSYPSHQRSLDSAVVVDTTRPPLSGPDRKPPDQYKRRLDIDGSRSRKTTDSRRTSPGRPPATGGSVRRNGSTEIPGTFEKKSSPRASNVSGSSSGSDVWLTASRVSSVKGSGASTPVDTFPDQDRTSMSRPGSAPTVEVGADLLVAQQRSMSLPKSFLSGGSGPPVGVNGVYLQSGEIPWQRQGTDSLGSSPGLPRKIPTPEVAHTAPVTPLHEVRRGVRSPLGPIRRTKASSTPHLSDSQIDSRKWRDQIDDELCLDPAGPDEDELNRNTAAPNTESVLQKFRKTFSLRFPQRKSSKDSCGSEDTASEAVPSEEESSPARAPSTASSAGRFGVENEGDKEEQRTVEQKYRFGPLIWRSSKERKKLNKAARDAKCNSGDSGIQIEMPGGGGPTGGDSSESHDTDGGPPYDSPPVLRRKHPSRTVRRPHSDHVSRIVADKLKADLKHHQQQQQRSGGRPVRRSRSDLGGQRLLGWEQRQAARRLLRTMASPRKRPPDSDCAVVLRKHSHGAPPRRPALRRSLSQPIDIDKLSPVLGTRTIGNRTVALSEDEHENRAASHTSDEDTTSDSDVSSVASFSGRKKSLELAGADEDLVVLAEAVFDHVAIEADELAFRAGDVVEIEEMADREWWWGSTGGRSGWFPAQFVRLRVSQEDTVEDCLAAIAAGRPASAQIRRRTSVSLLSNDQVRTSVVRELVHTERDFVKVLQDVAEGYLSECRKREDMFNEEQIATIFINLEEILRFQRSFLRDLETCVDWDAPHRSCVGECFLKHSVGFKMYSDYCNSHPMATAALQELYQYNNYSKFFEACRLMRGLIEIPLDGYLLTPVQRICKYPLQLAELLKYTRTDHEDYANIKEALEVMRGVAMMINERKRRMESLEKLAGWQQRVEAWEGEDLIELSSQLIHQGEVVRVTSGMWTNNITLFLFDHQIVYCKKDILKRNTYVYKGRICLDTSEIIDVPDGKDSNLGVSVRHAIKLLNQTRDKFLIFCCRSAKDKQRWLDAFIEERKLVARDRVDGLELPQATRHLARAAASRQKRPPRKLRQGKKLKHQSGYIGSSMLQLNVTGSNSLLGRKMGTWFSFGGGKKSRHHDVP